MKTSTDCLQNFTAEGYELGRYEDCYDNYQLLEKKANRAYRLLSIAQGIIFTAGLCIAISLCAYNDAHGHSSRTDFPSLLYYWMQLQQPLSLLGYTVNNMHKGFVDMEKVLEFMSRKPDIKEKKKAPGLILTRGNIEFKDVSFSYEGPTGKLILSQLSFQILPGQTVAIVGTSGGGKSTIYRLLQRLFDLSSGSIIIDGQNIQDVAIKSLRSMMGLVPQVTLLWLI
jgi:ABC-type transport system involved in Fe-S cluster assembly fused permease/ATPase subunit